MKSPNGAFEVFQHHYEEVRMGSPLFGQLEIRGSRFGHVAGEFAEPLAFSPDSRFLAAAELAAVAPDPGGRIVVFDFERSVRVIVYSFPGFARHLAWELEGTLAATTWSLRGGEDTRCIWSPPPPKPPSWWQHFLGRSGTA